MGVLDQTPLDQTKGGWLLEDNSLSRSVTIRVLDPGLSEPDRGGDEWQGQRAGQADSLILSGLESNPESHIPQELSSLADIL